MTLYEPTKVTPHTSEYCRRMLVAVNYPAGWLGSLHALKPPRHSFVCVYMFTSLRLVTHSLLGEIYWEMRCTRVWPATDVIGLWSSWTRAPQFCAFEFFPRSQLHQRSDRHQQHYPPSVARRKGGRRILLTPNFDNEAYPGYGLSFSGSMGTTLLSIPVRKGLTVDVVGVRHNRRGHLVQQVYSDDLQRATQHGIRTIHLLSDQKGS